MGEDRHHQFADAEVSGLDLIAAEQPGRLGIATRWAGRRLWSGARALDLPSTVMKPLTEAQLY